MLSETESYVTKYAYDGVGNILTLTDKENKVTAFTYDALSRKTKVTDAALGVTEFSYDNRDNLLSLKDAKGQTTLFEYDRNNHLTKETRPMDQTSTYAYDGAGNLIRKVDPKNQKIEYGYDDAGRLGTVKYFSVSLDTSPGKTVGFTFDKAGNLKTYNDGVTSGSYTYDDAYRKLSESVNYGGFSLGYSYTYYKNGQKKSFTDPSGITYEYGYDTNNQLSTLSIPNVGVTTYNKYTWTMPATITLPGGTKKDNTYTPLMQPKTIEVKDVAQTSLMAYGYGYSASGNITSKTTEHGNYGYQYDQLYRLINAANPTPASETFTYDAVGNRLTSSDWTDWTYNRNNELTSYDSVVYEYDANGNTTKKTANGQLTSYVYDIDNRLTKITREDGSTVAEYYYDIFGRRLSKTVGGTTSYYLYADEGLIGEYTSAGTEIKTYGYEPGSTWTTNPLFQKVGTNYYWYQNDHLGTPQKIVDGTGRVVWSATYDAFGKATVTISEIENNLRFPGQYYDAETGQHYNWNRYYDPGTGRYVTADPIGLQAGVNLFGYVGEDPINSVDPLGLYGRDVHHDDTRQLAASTGYRPCAADIIAKADQDIDDDPQTDPWDRRRRELWHFPTEARVNDVQNIALHSCDLTNLGRALHVLQDSFSHAGYPAWRGHFPLTTPDNPHSNPVAYNNMLNAAGSLLNKFMEKCGSGCCK
jgi:RHS repeat-associated protein